MTIAIFAVWAMRCTLPILVILLFFVFSICFMLSSIWNIRGVFLGVFTVKNCFHLVIFLQDALNFGFNLNIIKNTLWFSLMRHSKYFWTLLRQILFYVNSSLFSFIFPSRPIISAFRETISWFFSPKIMERRISVD